MNKIENKIYITPLGGLEEIGKNCLIIENSSNIIMIDCGLKFSNDTSFGAQFEIPDFDYINKNIKKFKNIIFTHGHLDHVGAISYLLNKIDNINIYGSNFTLEILKKQLTNHQIKYNNFIEIKNNKSINIGNINFLPFNVNHSIIESFGFVIDFNIKGKSKIVHTGDFNLDPNPYKRSTTNLNILKKFKNEILLLLSDSTNSTQKVNLVDEKKVFESLETIYKENKNKNKIIITTFSTQIPRILKIFELSNKYNRKVFLSGRSIVENLNILIERPEYKYLSKNIINHKEIKNHKKLTVIASGTQGEEQASINRISEGSHKMIKPDNNDLILFSSSVIPGNEKAVFSVWNRLSKNKIEYITPQTNDIHTTGHGAEKELSEILKNCHPEYFLPLHGESRHLQLHKEIAIKYGIDKDKIFIIENGQKIEIFNGKINLKEKIKVNLKVISNQYKEINYEIINERKEIGLSGVIFIQIIKNNKIIINSQSYGIFHATLKKTELEKLNIYLKSKLEKLNIKLDKKNYNNIQKIVEEYFKSEFLSIPKIILNFNVIN